MHEPVSCREITSVREKIFSQQEIGQCAKWLQCPPLFLFRQHFSPSLLKGAYLHKIKDIKH